MLVFHHSTFTLSAHLLEAAGQPEVYGKVVYYWNKVANQARANLRTYISPLVYTSVWSAAVLPCMYQPASTHRARDGDNLRTWNSPLAWICV